MLKVASFMALQRPLCDANQESKSPVSSLLHYTELDFSEFDRLPFIIMVIQIYYHLKMIYYQAMDQTHQSYHLSLLLMVIIGMLLTIHIQICLTQNLTKNLINIDTAGATKFDGCKTLFAAIKTFLTAGIIVYGRVYKGLIFGTLFVALFCCPYAYLFTNVYVTCLGLLVPYLMGLYVAVALFRCICVAAYKSRFGCGYVGLFAGTYAVVYETY